MDQDVLNPRLYGAIQRIFGEVRVRNRGEARIVHPDPVNPNVKKTVQWGEQYMVRCMFCRDRDLRLAISYEYGQRNDSGLPNTHLAYCFNRKCLTDANNRERVAAMLLPCLTGDDVIHSGKVVSEQERHIDLPTSLTPVHHLSVDHPARRFLLDRGLDPQRVGYFYGVTYCEESDDWLERHRLIIPVRQGDQLKGWQSVSITPPDGAPIYMSARGMQNSRLVYNLDIARNYHTGVIVGEPMAVWAFGPMAVCPLGITISAEHVRLLSTAFRRRTTVILLPSERFRGSDVSEMERALSLAISGKCIRICLPSSVGFLERAKLLELVRNEAEAKGFELDLKKAE